jgi:Ca2+-binding EF-hand superfamily protein
VFDVEENKKKLENIFDRLDSSTSGLISFRQFMLVTIALSSVPLEDKLIRIFRLIDNNNDGVLTYDEFEDVIQDILVLKEEEKLATRLVESVFTESTFRDMGMNSNGNIVLKDFIEACSRKKFSLINYIENFRNGLFVVVRTEETTINVEETETTTITFMRQKSVDQSCTTGEEDIEDIVDPSCDLTPEEVKKTFADLRNQDESITQHTFVNTMMAFFPKFNMEENRRRLQKLFDRLDSNSSGLISFRQFMLVTIAFSNVSLEDKLVRIFRLIDNNDDGELTYEEFEDVVQDILVLKEERKLSTSLVESRFSENTFRDMGMNYKGNIVLRDFVDACAQNKFILINYIENFKDGFQT